MTYRKHWSVERVSSKWKARKVIESHSFRGLTGVRLLIMLYALMVSVAKLADARKGGTQPAAA